MKLDVVYPDKIDLYEKRVNGCCVSRCNKGKIEMAVMVKVVKWMKTILFIEILQGRIFFAAMENKSNMVIRYKSYQEQQERIRLLAEDYMYGQCGKRKSKKMVEAYIGLANLIEYQTSEKVREKKKNTLVNLSSRYLKEQFGRHYADMIDDLKRNGIIKVNEKYSRGAFTKSYSVNDELLSQDKQHGNKMYTTAKAMDKDIRVYNDMIKICPDSIMFDGIEYRLDKEKMMKEVEKGNLGVNQAVRGGVSLTKRTTTDIIQTGEGIILGSS